MLSVVALAGPGDDARSGDITDVREAVVRSLGWLVSAAVVGVVRDVVLAGAPSLDLGDIADHAGCSLAQAEDEAELIAKAVALTRSDVVLVLRAGHQPDGPLIEELERIGERGATRRPALILAAPDTFIQRVLPNRCPVVGILLPRSSLESDRTLAFRAQVRRHRGAARLATRLRAIR